MINESENQREGCSKRDCEEVNEERGEGREEKEETKTETTHDASGKKSIE
jgi:hypothetical protein